MESITVPNHLDVFAALSDDELSNESKISLHASAVRP
jgi:hypothetical protein